MNRNPAQYGLRPTISGEVALARGDPAGYPVERLLAQFRWIVGEALGRREGNSAMVVPKE